MSITRAVEPEWLDELPVDDERAVRSRRDLRGINALMLNAALIAGELKPRCSGRSDIQIAELGAGDGTFMLQLARKMPLATASVVLLDRQEFVDPGIQQALTRHGYAVERAVSDVFEWLESSRATFDVMIANLFLHHFDAQRLARLLTLIESRTTLFVACEPRRSRVALAASRLLGLIGCNDVTRHDAVVSVRAGFAGAELSALWPNCEQWHIEERAAGPFSHLFVASQTAASEATPT